MAGGPRIKAQLLFLERMKREGRGKEWYDRVREKSAGRKGVYGAVSREVMRDMGFVSAAREEELARLYEDSKQTEPAYQRSVEGVRRKALDDELRPIEDVLRELPLRANSRTELDWVRTHPKMRAGATTAANTGTPRTPLKITTEDVKNPCNGKAPSQYAVTMLMVWVNKADEFFEKMLSKSKATIESGGDEDSPAGAKGGRGNSQQSTIDDLTALIDDAKGDY